MAAQHRHQHGGAPMVVPTAAPPPSSIDSIITLYDLVSSNSRVSLSPSASLPSDPSVAAELTNVLNTISDMVPWLARGPFPHCPPPPPPPGAAGVPPNPRSQQIQKVKEDGNTAYGQGNYQRAVDVYTVAAEMAATRPLFEHSAWMREELAVLLCNRCAAFQALKKWPEALADAETTIGLKRNWSKGHFRKAKTYQLMERWEEAKDALLLGLEFDPDNKDLIALKSLIEESHNKPKASSAEQPAPPELLTAPLTSTGPASSATMLASTPSKSGPKPPGSGRKGKGKA